MSKHGATLIVLLFAATLARAGDDLPEAMIRDRIEHEEYQVSYLRSAQGSGQRVIFVHGTPGSARAWDGFLQARRGGFDPIAVDRPGFGQTLPAKPETRFGTQAAVLEPLLLGDDGEPSILVGHSLGAAIVFELAARFPESVRGVISVAGALDPDLEHVYWIQHLGRVAPFRWILPTNLYHSNLELIAYEKELRALAPKLAKVAAPVWILHGTKDRLVPYANAAYMQRTLTGAASVELVTIPDGNHFLPWNSPERIWDLLDRAAGRSKP